MGATRQISCLESVCSVDGKSIMSFACGDAVVVATMRNAATVSDVAAVVGVVATDDVVVMVGATDAVVFWVQRCLMRPCTSPQFSFVLVVVTPMRKEPSWWDQ